MKKLISILLCISMMLCMALASAETIETDVVVVGGGGAGISAAIAAAQNGAKVVLLEKVGYLGGATLMSGGLIPAVGTKQQIEAGINDNNEWFVRDIMRPSNYSVREDLVYTVAEQAKPTIEWLEGLGVKFSVVTSSLYYGQSNYRMHLAEGSGKGLTTTMVAALEAMPEITVMLNTAGTGLITNEAGEVIGVKAGDQEILAKNTVLATSGFAANKEMVAKYIPEMKNAYPLYAPGATGEGILWGAEIGAAIAKMGAYQGHAFYSEAFGASVDQGIANRGGIFVNQEGVRFCNEYGGYSELSPHVLHQPGNYAYMIFDQTNADATAKFAQFNEAGIVITADTPEALAEKLGIDPAKLAQTFAEYQASIERGEDEFNRTKLPKAFVAPFHAIKITGDLRHPQGGLVTDVATHVLKEDGSLIPGLYAAGGVTESFSSAGGAAYMSGNGLLQAIIYGKIAGERAATEVRGEAQVVTMTIGEEVVEEEVVTAVGGADVSCKDGAYEGAAQGHVDQVAVKVTGEGGKIAAIEVTAQNETPAIFGSAEKPMIEKIIAANGTVGVDAVAGATHSSDAIIGAVEAALAGAL